MEKAKGLVGILVLFGLLLLPGCWVRRQGYDLANKVSKVWCEEDLAKIRNAYFGHVVLKRCYLSVLPPFYWCSPMKGFRSRFFIESKGPGPVLTTVDAYKLVLGDPPISIDPLELRERPERPLLSLDTGLGGVVGSPDLTFRIPRESVGADALIYIRGTFQSGSRINRFECRQQLKFERGHFEDTAFRTIE